MNDVINRKDAIGAILSVGHIAELSDGDAVIRVSAVNYVLRNLPSAQPGWIPCTPETMPEKTDTYLVQVGINKNGEGMHTEVRTAVWNVIWQKWYVHTTHCFVGDIIKWMPIPWEGGQDD